MLPESVPAADPSEGVVVELDNSSVSATEGAATGTGSCSRPGPGSCAGAGLCDCEIDAGGTTGSAPGFAGGAGAPWSGDRSDIQNSHEGTVHQSRRVTQPLVGSHSMMKTVWTVSPSFRSGSRGSRTLGCFCTQTARWSLPGDPGGMRFDQFSLQGVPRGTSAPGPPKFPVRLAEAEGVHLRVNATSGCPAHSSVSPSEARDRDNVATRTASHPQTRITVGVECTQFAYGAFDVRCLT